MGDIINPATLPDPSERYVLGACLGVGIFGQVYVATDKDAGGKKVAVKIQNVTIDTEKGLLDEYNILKDFCPSHSNLVDFYGIFCDKSASINKIWFVMEVLYNFLIQYLFINNISMNRTVEYFCSFVKTVLSLISCEVFKVQTKK